MTDESRDWLDDLLDDAVRTYNSPPAKRHMPLGEMWREIDAQVFAPKLRWPHGAYWLSLAAAVVIGVGIGRLSYSFGTVPGARGATPVARGTTHVDSGSRVASSGSSAQQLDPVTARYIGQATALLIALPTEAHGRLPDRPFIERANELLLTTRLLLDSQAAQDPSFRNLLEDLELVLVQVVQLEKDRDHSRQTELDLIQQALEQHDVLPRLRTAASEYAAD